MKNIKINSIVENCFSRYLLKISFYQKVSLLMILRLKIRIYVAYLLLLMVLLIEIIRKKSLDAFDV